MKIGVIQLKSPSFFKFSTMMGSSYYQITQNRAGSYIRIRFFSTFIEESPLNPMSDVHDFLLTIFRSFLLSRFLLCSFNLSSAKTQVVEDLFIFGFWAGFLAFCRTVLLRFIRFTFFRLLYNHSRFLQSIDHFGGNVPSFFLISDLPRHL